MAEQRIGYLVDQSHPPLIFAAVQGLGEVLEHGLRTLERPGLEVSPIVVERRRRMVLAHLPQPESIAVQIVQHEGRLERMTEILGVGIGMGVLREVRSATAALDLELSALSAPFRSRIESEKAAYVDAYARSKEEGVRRATRLDQILERFQEEGGRGPGPADPEDQGGEHSHPSLLFRLRLPKAIRELDRAIEDLVSSPWERTSQGRAVEIASALAQACQVEGLREAAALARSISSLISVPPHVLRSVKGAFHEKLEGLLSSLRKLGEQARNEAAS